MAIDIQRLEPVQLVRLLNSTPLGTVIDARQLYRHRNRAGYHFGDEHTIDLLKYAAWLSETRRARRTRGPKAAGEAMRDEAARRRRDLSQSVRDIGRLPRVGNPKRKKKAKTDLRYFCEAYFPNLFPLAFSPDHLKVISRMETATTQGGQFALAMPKGTGKTCIAICACLWAMLYGLRDFVCLIGASKDAAAENIDSIKMQLDTNPRLLADFPEAIYPIRKLEGIANRCSGQLYRGDRKLERTHIEWQSKMIVLPSMPKSQASGAIIRVAGITGRIAGMSFTRPDGKDARPSLVIIDDPQTDESAYSTSQCESRERTIMESVLGLAGPKKKTTTIMLCTVWRTGDVADNLLDREKHPDWNGMRTKMIYTFPTNEKLWAKYADARANSLRMFGDLRDATAFYRAHREDMDAGAQVAWPERFNPDELSAVQHAMNLKLKNERAFWAIYQNEPMLTKGLEDEEILSADEIAEKMNGHRRRSVPIGANHVVMYMDVQGKVIYYVVAAFEEDFTGYIIDYGAYPDQRRQYFTLRDADHTLRGQYPKAGKEGAIRAGLEALTADYLNRDWHRADGAILHIERCMVDAGWEPDVVYEFCRNHPQKAVLLPSIGRYHGARSRPFEEYRAQKGDRVGHHWRVSMGARRVRHAVYDTNFWKTFLHARLAIPLGDHGCLSLFGRCGNRADIEGHRMFAEHLTAEYREKTEGRGGIVDEWLTRPGGGDNHLFDCAVGCCMAASMQNVAVPGTGGERKLRKRVRRSFREWQQQVRSGKPR